jgi:hypothetical protein
MQDDFTQEELDRMYDEAMKWVPPTPGVSSPGRPQADPHRVLQQLIARRQAQGMLNVSQARTIPNG